MEAIVLAGGKGTRLKSVISEIPKPMAPIGEKPFLEYLLDYWIEEGVTRFVLSVGYKSEVIQNHFGNKYRGIPIGYAVEEEPLGTGGGLQLAIQKVKSNRAFLVLNGDTLFRIHLKPFLLFHKRKEAECTLAILRTAGNHRYGGLSIDIHERISALGRLKMSSAYPYMNGGAYFMEHSFLELPPHPVNCSLEEDLLPQAQENGKLIYGWLSESPFLDIGIPQDYAAAQQENYWGDQK